MKLEISQLDTFKIVTLGGRIDWNDAEKLDAMVQEIINEGFSHIVFDLDDVLFICSGGIGALVYNLNKVRSMGGGIYIISDNEYVNFIFDTLKFDIVFDGCIFATHDDFRKEMLGDQPG